MRANSVYARGINWPLVTRTTHELAARAKTTGDTYYAIQWVVDQIRKQGDGHAIFMPPQQAKGWLSAMEAMPYSLPTVSVGVGRLGYIKLPTFSAASDAAQRRYVSAALAGISRVESRHRRCGWIVDLSDDSGGNMFPMIFSVGPILGDGMFIGFRDKHGVITEYDTYHDGAITVHKSGGITHRLASPVKLTDLQPPPPVAVITSARTNSAGEAVTVAFRGRPNTRSFGTATTGATNAPGLFTLPDGAALLFGVVAYVDRTGRTYWRAIEPDQPLQGEPPEKTAQGWLLRTPACR